MKKIMNYRFLSVLCLLFFFNGVIIAQANFPQSWVGTYKGEVNIFAVDSVAMKVPMTLNIQLTNSDTIFRWEITYEHNGGKDVRLYELIVKDAQKGWYQIDEKNSIVIDAYYRNGYFTSCFEVMESFIIASYAMEKEGEIIFEIIAGETKAIHTTGNVKHDGEDIPEVKSYPINSRQKAVLTSQN